MTTIVSPGQAEETKGFVGERFDSGAGLQYLNARYYDPQLGIFIQPDWWEVNNPGVGTNRYAYSHNDPVNLADPGGNVPYNPGGSTSTGYHNQDTEDEYYTSHTDHKHEDYETYNYPSDSGADGSDNGSVSGGNNSKETSTDSDNPHLDEPAEVVEDFPLPEGISGDDQFCNANICQNLHSGEAIPADGVLFTAALGPVKIGQAILGAAFRRFVPNQNISDQVTLYRSVSEDEYQSIQETGQFTTGPNSLEGKWFWENEGAASEFGEVVGQERIVKGTVSRSLYNSSFRRLNLDNIGDAVYIDPSEIINIVPK